MEKVTFDLKKVFRKFLESLVDCETLQRLGNIFKLWDLY